jgi:hypothetical protein
MLKKSIFILSIVVATISGLYSQNGGLQVHAGYIAAFNGDKNFSPSGFRGGYRVIADGRLIGGSMHFLVGGGFGNMAINATSAPGFSSDSYNFFSGRIGIGFTILRISRDLRLRSKIIGTVHFVGDVDETKIENPEYRQVNDSYGGASTGLGIDMGWLTFDVEYEVGLINMIFEKPDTKLHILSLTAGFMF